MAMDFFAYQEQAHKRTGRLVVLYTLAVLTTMGLAYFAVSLFVYYYRVRGINYDQPQPHLWDLEIFWLVGGGTVAVVAYGMISKFMEMGEGGVAVARGLGGTQVEPGTHDPVGRKVRNVVEEMAIASGVPVPEIFIVENENRINAFAAGYTPDHAVIGITRGAAEVLSRDELQGVVAHEFSHILNGDMRLDLRLLCTLNGILVIGLLGTMLMRIGFYSGGGYSRRRGQGGGAAIAILGIALIAIGYLGTFFGKLIKAGVSRQREYLADASAVSFTRNPDGIAGALKKIGGSVGNSRLHNPRAEEFSHMYFSAGTWVELNLLATHPPLEQRIKRIEPMWNGRYPEVQLPEPGAAGGVTARSFQGWAPRPQTQAAPGGAAQAWGAAAAGMAVASAISQVGQPTRAHLNYAQELLDKVPDEIQKGIQEPPGAQALVYAMLLNKEEEPRKKQWAQLEGNADHSVVEKTRAYEEKLKALGEVVYLPLVDLSIPALWRLSRDEYESFEKNLEALILADEQVEPFEWVLKKIVLRNLEPTFHEIRKPVVEYYNLHGVRRYNAVLLSVLARAGQKEESAIADAFAAGAPRVELSPDDLQGAEDCSLQNLDEVLAILLTVTPRFKRAILEACAATIAFDRQVTVREGELLRGIADTLDCPMPPLLPGQPLS